MTLGLLGHRVPESVYVSPHAVMRMRDRFPEFARWEREALLKLARWEISEAYRAGRVAKTEPRWVVSNPSAKKGTRGRRGQAKGGNGRFAWNAQEVRCYAVVETKHMIDRRPRVEVRTVFARKKVA